MQIFVHEEVIVWKEQMNQNPVQLERLVMIWDCITSANVHHVQKDTFVTLVERQAKQGNVKKAISVSKVQSVRIQKSVLLENTVQLAPMFPSPVQLEPFLMLLACGKKNNVQIVLLGHTVLSKEEPTPPDHAEKVTFVPLGPQ